MTVESATYISDLNSSNPGSSDLKAEGDDHLRLLKSTIKATFPNVAGAVSASHTELSYVTGATSAIQTQIGLKANAASSSLTGVATLVGSGAAGAGDLTVSKAANYGAVTFNKPAVGNWTLSAGNTTANAFEINFNAFAPYLTLDSSGNLGIGAASSGRTLQVTGTFGVTGSSLFASDVNYVDGSASWAIGRSSSFNSSGGASAFGLRSNGSAFEFGFSGSAPVMKLTTTGALSPVTVNTTGDNNGSGLAIARYKTATTARTSTTTLADDPHLIVPLPVGKFAFEAWVPIFAASGTTGGMKAAIAFSGTQSNSVANCVSSLTALSTACQAIGSVFTISAVNSSSGANDWLLVKGTMDVSVAGNLSFQWAQNTTDTHSLSVSLGAYLTCTKVG